MEYFHCWNSLKGLKLVRKMKNKETKNAISVLYIIYYEKTFLVIFKKRFLIIL
jgi:hypothetical protein